MKSIILTSLGLLLSIASYSQKGSAAFKSDLGSDNSMKYEVTRRVDPLSGGRVNYVTVYCVTNDIGTLVFQLRLIHHPWENSMTSFLSVRSSEGKFESECEPDVNIETWKMDARSLSNIKKLEDGRQMLFGDADYHLKWFDDKYLGLNSYATTLDSGVLVGLTFK